MDKHTKLKHVLDNVRLLNAAYSSELIDETHQLLLELGSTVNDSTEWVKWYDFFIYGLGGFDIRLATKEGDNLNKVCYMRNFELTTDHFQNALCRRNVPFDAEKGVVYNMQLLNDNGYTVIKTQILDITDIVGIGKNMEYVNMQHTDRMSDKLDFLIYLDGGGFTISMDYSQIA